MLRKQGFEDYHFTPEQIKTKRMEYFLNIMNIPFNKWSYQAKPPKYSKTELLEMVKKHASDDNLC
jgi:hypothetical protein